MNDLLLAAVALGDQIERLGSYLGFAAVVGLGVLSLLYFAQAREVKRLREWAGRAPERDAELAQRVQSAAQKRVVAQPIPQPVVPAQPGAPQTAAAQQADAARKAAAAAVMEKFQPPGAAGAPVVGPPGQLARPVTAAGAPGTVPAPAPTAVPAPGSVPAAASASASPAAAAGSPVSTDAAGAGAPPLGADAATPGAATPGTGGPTTAPASPPQPPAAATASAAAAAARQAGPPSRSPAFANGAGGQDTHESAAARPEPLPLDLPSRPPRAPAASGRGDDDRGTGRSRVGLIVGGVGSALVIAVVAVVVLSSGGDAPPAGNEIGGTTPPPAASSSTPSSSATKVDRKATQVAVLNGTTQTGLARSVGNKLESGGFTILSVGDNADQQIATTTISYSEGNERAARVVAQIMDVPRSAVQPIDLNTATAVAPEAKVVVVVGNDRSSTG